MGTVARMRLGDGFKGDCGGNGRTNAERWQGEEMLERTNGLVGESPTPGRYIRPSDDGNN